MAYVRITERLKDGIRDIIQRMRAKAEEMHGACDISYGTALFQELEAALLSQAWCERPDLQDQMPDKWCHFTSRLTAELDNESGRKTKSVELDIPGDQKIKLPCKPNVFYHDNVRIAYEHQSDALRQWVAEEDDRLEAIRATRAQYNTVQIQIVAFLQTKTSLNAALKEMPELELYVPDEFMQKFHEATERRADKSAEDQPPAVEVDRDQLAALGVAHRMATAAE